MKLNYQAILVIWNDFRKYPKKYYSLKNSVCARKHIHKHEFEHAHCAMTSPFWHTQTNQVEAWNTSVDCWMKQIFMTSLFPWSSFFLTTAFYISTSHLLTLSIAFLPFPFSSLPFLSPHTHMHLSLSRCHTHTNCHWSVCWALRPWDGLPATDLAWLDSLWCFDRSNKT